MMMKTFIDKKKTRVSAALLCQKEIKKSLLKCKPNQTK
jgi:hypothetical protein